MYKACFLILKYLEMKLASHWRHLCENTVDWTSSWQMLYSARWQFTGWGKYVFFTTETACIKLISTWQGKTRLAFMTWFVNPKTSSWPWLQSHGPNSLCDTLIVMDLKHTHTLSLSLTLHLSLSHTHLHLSHTHTLSLSLSLSHTNTLFQSCTRVLDVWYIAV